METIPIIEGFWQNYSSSHEDGWRPPACIVFFVFFCTKFSSLVQTHVYGSVDTFSRVKKPLALPTLPRPQPGSALGMSISQGMIASTPLVSLYSLFNNSCILSS